LQSRYFYDIKRLMQPRRLIYYCFILLAIYSCKRTPIGLWDDNIHLSQKNFNFSGKGDSALVTAGGKWWGLNASLDTVMFFPKAPMADACNFSYADSNLALISRTCDTLFIKMNENRSGRSRTLTISMSAGDYFDGVRVVQAPK